MKRFFSLSLAVLAVACFVSCGKKRETLHIYNWGDYMSQEVIAKFEQEFNCDVKVDTFDSNEAMYAKLKTGAGGYDIIVPSSYMAKLMHSQDMLEELDKSKLGNVVKFMDKSYGDLSLDSNMTYSVPYFVSFTGIGYNAKAVTNFEPSWRMFERPELKGQVTLLDDVREVMGCALKTLGYDANSTDQKQIDEAVALVKSWKRQIAKFGVDDAKMSLASGEFKLIQTYSGDMLQVMMENPDIKFVIPREGSTVTFDNFAIMKGSEQKALAYEFINFMYRTENATANMNEIMYITPHVDALKQVDPSLQENPAFNIPVDERKRCTAFQDLGDENEKFNRAWDLIKSDD